MSIFRRISTLTLICLAAGVLQAADSPREKLLLDLNWKFSNGDPSDAGNHFDYQEADLKKQNLDSEKKEAALAAKRQDPVKTNLGGDVSWVKADFDDSKWRVVNLPHDWAIELPFEKSRIYTTLSVKGSKKLTVKDGTGIGWYRRTFEIAPGDAGKTMWIEFGGSYRNTLVWLNGHCLGRMESGYTPFYYDVTKLLNHGGKNTLVVRAEAVKNEGWFYEGAGLYRHVWLVKTAPVHVAHWGTYVTSTVSGNDVTVKIETIIENNAAAPASATVISAIQDSTGTVVAQKESQVDVPASGQFVLKQSVPVTGAKLWSPETPNLYSLVTRIEGKGGVSDLYKTPFGIRTIEFSPEKGFLLNGQRRFIKGVCNHQDFAGVGVAVPDRLQEYRVHMFREMGCDGWRTSHNPVNEELLDECDRQGMMVMDETRRFGKYAQPLSDLKAMMLRDRNHPSIVIWCLGNEEADGELQGTPEGAEACKVMQDLAHQIDPSRPCTLAINRGYDNEGFTTVLDVTGINYLALWRDMDGIHSRHPERRFICTEDASAMTTRGMYFDDKPGGYMAAYDRFAMATAEGWVNHYATRPWVAGGFAWTGYDYRGEPTPYGWPCISSHFGILDTCGFPKDIYYYYKAWWTKEIVLHLYPHWNWNQVSHRIIRFTPKATLDFSVLDANKAKGTGNPGSWIMYDNADIKTATVYLRKIEKQPGKKDKVTDVVKQDVPIGDKETTIPLQALPGQEALFTGENTVTISKEEAPLDIWVQTNCEEAELFVNGVSHGRNKVTPLRHLQWDAIPYVPGNISVTGYKGGQAVKTETLETTGAPAALRITANREKLNGDGEDVVLVKVEALDATGRFVPTAMNQLHFEVTGNGKLIGVGNGDPSCHESDLGPDRSLFNGLALGVVQAARAAGRITVKVSGQGLKDADVTLPVTVAPIRPCVPCASH